MTHVTYLTAEGLKKLREELDYNMNVERPRISKQIGEAIDKGDISENAEYDAAKDAQGLLEAKIAALQNKISHARIIDESKIDTKQVQILNRVTIRNQKSNAMLVYTIVPETEANLKEGKISVITPIAQGLMGKKVGDIVNIKVPAGIIPFEIVDFNVTITMATLFTKIANNEIPAYKVAEDDNFLAFLDIAPVTKGHTLVIPKKEVDYIFDLDQETYLGLQAFAKKVAEGLKNAVPCRKIGVMVLGLEVPHVHIHLVPMQSEADLLHFSKKLTLSKEEFIELRDRISANIM
jgi:transcription elongation factor GreA